MAQGERTNTAYNWIWIDPAQALKAIGDFVDFWDGCDPGEVAVHEDYGELAKTVREPRSMHQN